MGLMARIRVYVDAFNVYFGALHNRGPGTRWLDIEALVSRVLPKHKIDKVIYCTARVSDQVKSAKQDRCLAVLAAAGVEIVEGTYIVRRKTGVLVRPTPPAQFPPYVTIEMPEEKGSDVNIASRLLIDAYENRFQEAVVMSLDTDLCMPINHVTHVLKKPIGLLVNDVRVDRSGNLKSTNVPVELKRAVKYVRKYDEQVVRESQFVDPYLTASGAQLAKPVGW